MRFCKISKFLLYKSQKDGASHYALKREENLSEIQKREWSNDFFKHYFILTSKFVVEKFEFSNKMLEIQI